MASSRPTLAERLEVDEAEGGGAPLSGALRGSVMAPARSPLTAIEQAATSLDALPAHRSATPQGCLDVAEDPLASVQDELRLRGPAQTTWSPARRPERGSAPAPSRSPSASEHVGDVAEELHAEHVVGLAQGRCAPRCGSTAASPGTSISSRTATSAIPHAASAQAGGCRAGTRGRRCARSAARRRRAGWR